jgi:hypothetical protein
LAGSGGIHVQLEDDLPALDWIIDYLEQNEIPYLVCGGLAAQAYGSKRELVDIDLYTPDAFISQISSMGTDYITFGPAHHVGEKWVAIRNAKYSTPHQENGIKSSLTLKATKSFRCTAGRSE